MWAKESVLADNRALQEKNRILQQENRELRAYLRGLQTGLRKAVRHKDQGEKQ